MDSRTFVCGTGDVYAAWSMGQSIVGGVAYDSGRRAEML
jgi:hypothetical protein